MPKSGRCRALDEAKRREICAQVTAGTGRSNAARDFDSFVTSRMSESDDFCHVRQSKPPAVQGRNDARS
jgi:hypothetical protein